MFRLVTGKFLIAMLTMFFVGAILSCTILSFGVLFASVHQDSHTASAGHNDNHFTAHGEVLAQLTPVGAGAFFNVLLLMAYLFTAFVLFLRLALNTPILQARWRQLLRQAIQIRFLSRQKIISFLALFELSPALA